MAFLGSIHQYQNNTAANAQAPRAVREAGRPVPAQAQELAPGKVFEGTVTDIRNGQVTLGLSDGSSILARMEAGVSLEKGQPMLFEVKANTGEQIAIRPVTVDGAQNPTLLKALEAAGLKANDRNLAMVNQMMMEQLPIGKNSLLQMARALSSFPQADMQTLVQMQKLGFTINEDSLNQFQNYKNGQQAILPEMTALMEGIAELPEQAFGKEGIGARQAVPENIMLSQPQAGAPDAAAQGTGAARLADFQQQLVRILFGESAPQTGEAGTQAVPGQETGVEGNAQAVLSQETGAAGNAQAIPGQETGAEGNAQAVPGQETGAAGSAQAVPGRETGVEGNAQAVPGRETGAEGNAQAAPGRETGAEGNAQAVPGRETGAAGNAQAVPGRETGAEGNAQAVPGQETAGSAQASVSQILSKGQQNQLAAMLQEISGMGENGQLFLSGRLNASLSAGEMLRQIMKSAEGGKPESLQKLFLSKEYKALLKQAMADQWTLTPEQLKEEGAVKEFYQRLSRQMTELSQFLSQAGKEGGSLAETARSLQGSLDFMNQVNQMYAYVQLPLKLQNQNAHSDLYVYTNKKKLQDREGSLTALLHLDLEHLGTTDIYVKMLGTSVQTDFYLEDTESCRLLERFSAELVGRLEEKGYQCGMKVENRKKEQDFVQDFLEQEHPAGKLHRYSFDVKA